VTDIEMQYLRTFLLIEILVLAIIWQSYQIDDSFEDISSGDYFIDEERDLKVCEYFK
jgi:hypothetical protein